MNGFGIPRACLAVQHCEASCLVMLQCRLHLHELQDWNHKAIQSREHQDRRKLWWNTEKVCLHRKHSVHVFGSALCISSNASSLNRWAEKSLLWYRWAEKGSVFLNQGIGYSFTELFQKAVLFGAQLTAWGKRLCLPVPNVHVPCKAYVAATKCSRPLLHPSRRWHRGGSCLTHGVTS